MEIRADAKKYRRKDAEKYNNIIYIAYKPVYIRIKSRNKNYKSRRSLTNVYTIISGQNIWIISFNLIVILRKTDAWANIKKYYNNRLEEYFWKIPPKRVLTDKI